MDWQFAFEMFKVGLYLPFAFVLVLVGMGVSLVPLFFLALLWEWVGKEIQAARARKVAPWLGRR